MNKKKSKNKKQDKQSENPVPRKKEEEQTEELDWYVQNPEYRMRCKAAIDILQAKLKMINSKLSRQKEPVEIQLRTRAMDYWSVLEYQLYYKKSENEEVAAELKEYAEEIARLDGKMLKLRNKIEKI